MLGTFRFADASSVNVDDFVLGAVSIKNLILQKRRRVDLRWDFANGAGTIFNRHGKKFLTMEDASKLAKNSADEIIRPSAVIFETDEDKQ